MTGGYLPAAFSDRVRGAVGARGARPVAGDIARWAADAAAGVPWTVAGGRGRFHFQGRDYRYLYHPYKRTWLTERAVEVPIVQALVDAHAGRRVLEVGNVLSHYRRQSHVVIDRYERAPGVLNRDVLDVTDLGPFDLIVAISTLEHVGHDERPRDPAKAARAVVALRGRLAAGGQLVLTVPLGYNPRFDAALLDGELPGVRTAALRRAGGGTRWRETTPAEARSAPYDFLLYRARGVLWAVIDAGPG